MIEIRSVGMLEMEKTITGYNGILIDVLITNSSFYMQALTIAYDVLGMIEVELDGFCLFPIQVKTDPVIVLRNTYLQNL
jgi:predicted nucleic acid-binding protein